MGQTVAVLHIDRITYQLHPLLDQTSIFSQLTTHEQDILWSKSNDLDFKPFQLAINDALYEITMGSTPSGNHFALFTAHEEKALRSLFEIEATMREQQMKLFELAKSRSITKESLKETIENACETIAQLIQVERVGIWLFNPSQTVLEAQTIYDARIPTHNFGQTVDELHYPTYFEAVQSARSLAIHDVKTDPRVAEMYPEYFESMGGIRSMLDAPIMLSSGIGGVLCCESLSKRVWTELDQTLVGTLADMVAFLYERIYRIEAEARIEELAYVDQLTGLPNQNAFEDTVSTHLAEQASGTFIYLVIDQFATIQEVLGFDGGDEVLQEIAHRLKMNFKEPNVVARLAMDHFVLYLQPQERLHFEEKFMEIKKPFHSKGQEVYVTYSYGRADYPIHGDNVKHCLQSAQIALSHGKKLGSQSIASIFNPFMKEQSADILHTEFNLRKGLDMNEFSLYYQPQVNSRTGIVEGFEALIRWHHPDKGIIPPFDFIHHAESTGLILPIGEWVIEQAFQQLEKWQSQGFSTCTISINISPRHFLHEKLLPYLKSCLETYDVQPHQFVIEITENVAMGDYLAAQTRIAELHELGFLISIDDFGTGFSAFIYLQHFSIDEIKIDRQFILDIETNKKSLGIVKTIVDLANLLELRVVVEGVETQQQLELLQAIGCKTIQGYYYARPLPTSEIEQWFEKRSSHS
ncbi:GGDEF and EAL domain-containing protein [Chryseomicrobium sp. FSL W7-1435]|uniref:putative bifunctional diguanylate cyclase/phosphodiesterase n=1 Tax=Chryseomicrobium sp. FSL W7-1435 TaxID=2921704 RepID=UPI00315A4A3D